MNIFKSVPLSPPPPRVPQVVKRLEEAKRELFDLRLQIEDLALASAEGKPDARRNLASLGERIRATEFEIEAAPLARNLAGQLDEDAVIAWRAEVQKLSANEIIAGITKDECCDRCTAGCAILGGDPSSDMNECAHPTRRGMLSKYKANRQIQTVYAAACAKLGVSHEKSGANL